MKRMEIIMDKTNYDMLRNLIFNIDVTENPTGIVVVDFQNDFVDGSLAIIGAEELILPMEWFIVHAFYNIDRVKFIFTKDFHPENHCSFKENGGLWPMH